MSNKALILAFKKLLSFLLKDISHPSKILVLKKYCSNPRENILNETLHFTTSFVLSMEYFEENISFSFEEPQMRSPSDFL